MLLFEHEMGLQRYKVHFWVFYQEQTRHNIPNLNNSSNAFAKKRCGFFETHLKMLTNQSTFHIS